MKSLIVKRIKQIILGSGLLLAGLLHNPSEAQEQGFDDKLVAGLVSSFYAARGISLTPIKTVLSEFCDTKRKKEKKEKMVSMRIVVLRDGRVFLTKDDKLWFELAVDDGYLHLEPRPLPDVVIAFEAVTTTGAIRRNSFRFVATNLVPVVPPMTVTPERFLNHFLTWLRSRGFVDLEAVPLHSLAPYDLIARNHFVRVEGVEDIRQVLRGLEELGFDLDMRDEFGDTMLFAAIGAQDVDFVTALLYAQVDLDLLNNDGLTPDAFALDVGNEEIMELFDSISFNDSDESDDEEATLAVEMTDVDEKGLDSGVARFSSM